MGLQFMVVFKVSAQTLLFAREERELSSLEAKKTKHLSFQWENACSWETVIKYLDLETMFGINS